MIAAVALDLDGTLLRPDETISERSLAALRACRERGLKVIVATGRRPESIERVLVPGIGEEAWVCYNGSEIHIGGECIHRDHIDPEDSLRIVRWVQGRWPDCVMSVQVDGRLYLNRRIDDPYDYEVADLTTVITGPTAKIVVNLRPLAGADSIHANLPPGVKMLVTGGGSWGEIMTASASKAAGLALLLRRWGLTLAQTIAFGDDTNDIEMVRECGIGVAMGNAHEAVKAVADLVAPANDEDGVAVVLEALLAGELRPEPHARGDATPA